MDFLVAMFIDVCQRRNSSRTLTTLLIVWLKLQEYFAKVPVGFLESGIAINRKE